MSTLFCSSQHLWSVLRKYDVEPTSVNFRTIVKVHKDMLQKNVTYFAKQRRSGEEEKQTLKDNGVMNEVVEFVSQLSTEINVSIAQCYDLLSCFLLHEYSGRKRNLTAVISDEQPKRFLMSSIQHYYMQEELFIVKCLTKLIKLFLNTENQTFSDADLMKNVASTKFAVEVLRRFLDQYKDENFNQFLEKRGHSKCRRMIIHFLTMKQEILQLVLWAFHIFNFSADLVTETLDLLKIFDSCQMTFCEKFVDPAELAAFSKRIDCLKFLLIGKIFDLELLRYSYQNKEEFVQDDELIVLKLEDSITNYMKSFDEFYIGAVCLCRCLNLQQRKELVFNNDSEFIDIMLAKYGPLSKKFDCMGACLLCLESATYSNGIRNLLLEVLTNENVSDEFWSKNFSSGISQFVRDELLFKFPIAFDDVLRVLTSLCKSTKQSCVKTLSLFQEFFCFCEESSEFDRCAVVNEMLIQTEIDRNVKNLPAFVIPSGSIGKYIEMPGSSVAQVQWRVVVNAWQICLLEMSNSSSNSKQLMFELIDSLVTGDPNLASRFVHFYNLAAEILKSDSSLQFVDVPLLASCLRCLSSASISHSDEVEALKVVSLLVSSNVLPVLNVSSSKSTISNYALVGNVLLDYELKSGRFEFTCAFLQLIRNILNCDENKLFKNEFLTASFLFTVNDVFPHYQLWTYCDSNVKNKIAMLCLQIIQKAIEALSHYQKNSTKDDKMHQVVFDALLLGESRNSLLKIAAVGSEVLQSLLKNVDNEDECFKIFDQVAMALSSVGQLFKIDIRNSVAANQLFAIFATRITKTESFAFILGKYLTFVFDERLPRLSLICLKNFALHCSGTLLLLLGDNVEGFCDLLLNRIESPTECPQLKALAVDFLAVCVEHQPGLAERFICSGKQPDSINRQPSTDEYSGLQLVFDIIAQDDVDSRLFASCVGFFAVLWRQKCVEYTKILKQLPNFWPILAAPLTSGEEEFFLKICSEIWEILSYDLYMSTAKDQRSDDKSTAKFVVEKFFDSKSDRVDLTFKKIHEFLQSNVYTKEKLLVFQRWRNFVVVVVSRHPALLEETTLFKLISLTAELQLSLFAQKNPDNGILIKYVARVYETCLSLAKSNFPLSNHWISVGEVFGKIIEVLVQPVEENHSIDLYVSPLFGALTVLSEEKRQFVEKRAFIASIFESLCIIANRLFECKGQLNKMDNPAALATTIRKALCLTLQCISATVLRTDPSVWLPFLKRFSILSNIVDVLSTLTYLPEESQLFAAAVDLFTVVGEHENTLSSLRISGFCAYVCAKLPVSYTITILNSGTVFGSLLSFFTSTLMSTGYDFVDDVANFISSWEEIYFDTVNCAFRDPTDKNLLNLKRVCTLLATFARFNERWASKQIRLSKFLIFISSTICMRLIAYLSKPTLIKESPTVKTNQKPFTLSDVQRKFLDILLISLQILMPLSPSLDLVLIEPNFDADAFPLLCNLEFSTNFTPDGEQALTFGGLLLAIQLATGYIRKVDSGKSASPSASSPLQIHFEKKVASDMLECCVFLCISQGFLQIRRSQEFSEQASLVKRELGSELSLILTKCNKSVSSPSTPRKGGSSASSSLSPGGAASCFDQDFIKLAKQLINTLFKT